MNQKINLSLNKEWFILVKDQKIGPLTIEELKNSPDFNPNTLVWKKGFDKWIEARFIKELDPAFKDPFPSVFPDEISSDASEKSGEASADFSTLALDQNPNQLPLWVLFFIFILIYAIARSYF